MEIWEGDSYSGLKDHHLSTLSRLLVQGGGKRRGRGGRWKKERSIFLCFENTYVGHKNDEIEDQMKSHRYS